MVACDPDAGVREVEPLQLLLHGQDQLLAVNELDAHVLVVNLERIAAERAEGGHELEPVRFCL